MNIDVITHVNAHLTIMEKCIEEIEGDVGACTEEMGKEFEEITDSFRALLLEFRVWADKE